MSYYDSEKKFRSSPDYNLGFANVNLNNTSNNNSNNNNNNNNQSVIAQHQQPRRCIMLRKCLAIHRKYDSKYKHVMALYTKDEMHATICEEEFQLNEWLEAIRTILIQLANVEFIYNPLRDFCK